PAQRQRPGGPGRLPGPDGLSADEAGGGAAVGTICIAIPDSVWSARSEQFYTQVLHGLEATAVPRGHGVLSRVARDVEEELEALRHWAEQGLGTVVVLKDLQEDDARPRTVEALGLPYAVIRDGRQDQGSP